MASTVRSLVLSPFRPPLSVSLLLESKPKPFLSVHHAQPLGGRLTGGAWRPSSLPVIRAQSSPDYATDAKFIKVEAILRPWRVTQVSAGLLKIGIRGVTVSDVRGFGAQGGSTERQAGSEFSEDNFVAKVKMEIVVSKDQVETVIETITETARTGEIGDGKIFCAKLVDTPMDPEPKLLEEDVIPVSDIVRVRTGERGEKAEKMTGGRADMTTSTASN